VTRPTSTTGCGRLSFFAIVPIIVLELELVLVPDSLKADEVFILPTRTILSPHLSFREAPHGQAREDLRETHLSFREVAEERAGFPISTVASSRLDLFCNS
jgi:hypothetical protein